MILDFGLLAAVAILTVGLTVVGGFVASDKLWVRLCFLIGGPILVVGILWQGIRQIHAQMASDDAYMNALRENQKDRQHSDTKIDALYTLLQPRLKELVPTPAPQGRKLVPPVPAPPPTQSLLPPSNGKVVIVSQTPKTSTRSDAGYEVELVVQTTETFTSLKMAIQCDQPLVDVSPNLSSGGIQTMLGSGVLKEHPNIFVYSYSSSTPPFSPADPLIIDVWSKESITCNQVATF